MTDLSASITPKSNQLNADDLITGPRTIRITSIKAGNSEQPIAVHYEGDDGKPFYPCKSMRRVMVSLWGANGDAYKGRSLTLYRDPSVKWGGIEVGGIRISHMSDIESDQTMALTESNSKRAPFKVRRLVPGQATKQTQQQDKPPVSDPEHEAQVTSTITRLEACQDLAGLELLWDMVKKTAADWPADSKRRVAVVEKSRRADMKGASE